jgi:hypothetical protein
VSAPVRIEARAWSDLRFATLARLLGLVDADHALIKVARLWSWQTEHFAPDAPTYEVDADTIESVLGPGGPAALVRAKLADETPTGYRMRGTEGQIEWCDNLSSKRQQAGRVRADGARRDAKGRLMPHENGERGDSPLANGPAPIQHPSSAPPAKSSAPSPSPSPEEKNSPSACAIPRSPAPAPVGYDPVRDPMAIGRLAEATYRRVSDALIRVSAELKLPAPLPFPAINPGSSERTRDARDRVREEGADAPAVCDRIVANLIAQAREERSVEWLAEKAFTPGGWRTARAWMPGAAARRRGPARGDPLPPAPPPKRPEPPPPDPVLSPEDRAELLALADRLVANPDAAAAAELARGRSPAHIATAELVRRFGEGPAPPDTPDAIANESRKPPRRKAAT